MSDEKEKPQPILTPILTSELVAPLGPSVYSGQTGQLLVEAPPAAQASDEAFSGPCLYSAVHGGKGRDFLILRDVR